MSLNGFQAAGFLRKSITLVAGRDFTQLVTASGLGNTGSEQLWISASSGQSCIQREGSASAAPLCLPLGESQD